jgi:RNA-directed DNA polymerase
MKHARCSSNGLATPRLRFQGSSRPPWSSPYTRRGARASLLRGCSPRGHRHLPEDNLRRFRNRLRGMRDRWRAGTIDRKTVVQRVTSWIAHAECRHVAPALRDLPRRLVRSWMSQRRKPGPPPDAAGWFAGAPGTTNRRTCARPTATGTSPTTGTTTSASGSPVRPHAGADGPRDPPGVPRCVQGGP